MGRFRVGAFAGVVAASAVIAFGASNCASPTQIILDIRTDQSLCSSIVAGIVVTRPEEAESETALEIFQAGCESGTDRVGTLTITPSGANDASISIRVVGGVNGTHPDKCGRTDIDGKASWENCILSTRKSLQFAPGKTRAVTIVLSEQCVGQICGDGRECNLGKCVKPEQVQPDGTNAPIKDGDPPYEDVQVDAPADARLDAGQDACAFCKGPAATCNGAAGTCAVTCSNAGCKDQVVCGGGLDCTIDCTANDSCSGTRCSTSGSCTFNCTGAGQPKCAGIACNAGECKVACEDVANTCDGVVMEAGASTMTCLTTAGNKATCDNVTCSGGVCTRICADGGLGCGEQSKCTGNCTNWQDAGDGG
jgi:hypothetical protein